MDQLVQTKHGVKVYPAGMSGQVGGRAGFMIGGVYRPYDRLDLEEFTEATQLFVGSSANDLDNVFPEDDEFYTANDVSKSTAFFGPTRLFGGTTWLNTILSSSTAAPLSIPL